MRVWVKICAVTLLVALTTVVMGSVALAGESSIVGEWKRADGHAVKFSQDGDQIVGVITELGPVGAYGFTEGETTFRLKPTDDPNVFSGEIKWRWQGSDKQEWKPQTMTVSGDSLSGAGTWERLSVADSLLSSASSLWGEAKAKTEEVMASEEMQAAKQSAGELWDKTKEKSSEVMQSEEMQAVKEQAGEAWDATKETTSEVMASDEVQAAKQVVMSWYDKLMASLFGVDSIKSPSPADGIPIPQIECAFINEHSDEGYGFTNVKEQYFVGETLLVGYVGPESSPAWYGLFAPGKAVKDQSVQFGTEIDGRRLGGAKYGVVPVNVPPKPGCYELIMTNDTSKEAVVMARTTIKVVPDEDSPVPAVFIPRTVFAPGEMIAVEAPANDLWPKAFVMMVPAEVPHGDYIVASSKRKGSKGLGDVRDGVISMAAPREKGLYSLRVFTEGSRRGQELAHVDFEVRDIQWSGEPKIALDSESYEAGKGFSLVFNAMPDWHPKAWIALVPADAPDANGGEADKVDVAYLNLQQKKTGAWYVVAPKQPGKYEFRMFPSRNADKAVLKAGFEVALPEGYADRKPSMTIVSPTTYTFDPLVVDYVARKDWSSDSWFGLMRPDAPRNTHEAYKVALGKKQLKFADEGTQTFSLPAEPGSLELRMYGGPDANDLILTVPVEVVAQPDVAAAEATADAEAQEFLDSLPDYEEFDISDEQFEQFITVPEMPDIPLTSSAGEGALKMCNSGVQVAELRKQLIQLANYYYPDQPIYTYADVTEMTPPMLVQPVANRELDADCIDREIDTMTKLDLTLGRDNKFAESLQNLGLTLITKWNLPTKTGEKLTKAINVAVDTYNHGGASIAAIKKGNYSDAVFQAVTVVVKNMVTACGSPDCMSSVRNSADQLLTKYVAKLPAGKKAAFLNKMRSALGSDPFIKRLDEMEDAMNVGLNVDTGTGVVEANSGDYRRAIWTFTSSAAQIHPATATAVAVGTAGYEGMVAVRDMLVDETTQNLYKGYKFAFDGGKEGDAVWAGLSQGYAYPYAKVREMMIKNPTNPMVRKALTEGHRIRNLAGGAAKLKADQISEAEVEAYLKDQFEAWRTAEKKNTKFSRQLQEYKRDFDNLECLSAMSNTMKKARDEKGFFGRTKDSWNNYWAGSCDDAKTFAAYAKIRNDIDAELKKWSEGKGCQKMSQNYQSKKLACTLMDGGAGAYRVRMAKMAKDCGWKPSVQHYAQMNYANKLVKLNKYEKVAIKVLTKIGRTDLLHCMCRHNSPFHSNGYHPQKTKGRSPSCDNGSGPCIGGEWGCGRYSFRPGAAKACNVAGAIADYKKNLKNKK
ncbi:hypothetical protein [Pseudodesulfovibrio sp. zrk46]|uniref:hypothetical protein n=1 Tax=Pseudodesulfovibrio sp. zrk46 TaxID=2725288 RepID=UPI0014498BB2|nr:hypothetical protein [Pseudodesulfovibrio sp. zrk46]QJB56735.1 hypothetical protein HFN16_10105 [Pseudodesulfovibrio sp. zrk46]